MTTPDPARIARLRLAYMEKLRAAVRPPGRVTREDQVAVLQALLCTAATISLAAADVPCGPEKIEDCADAMLDAMSAWNARRHGPGGKGGLLS